MSSTASGITVATSTKSSARSPAIAGPLTRAIATSARTSRSVVQPRCMSTVESGLLNAFVLDGKGGAKKLDWSGVRAWTPTEGTLWLILDYTAPDVMEWLAKDAKIDPVMREALVDNDPR